MSRCFTKRYQLPNNKVCNCQQSQKMIFQFLILLMLVFATSIILNPMTFFTIIGSCSFFYILFYFICCCVFDCDVITGFAEKFGKPISSLRGKVVFITGASSGIGENLAIELAKCGVKLVLTARREKELERVKARCLEESKDQLKADDILVIPMDISQLESHEKYFYAAVNHFGRVDILVNNAGRSQRASWEKIEHSVHQQMFALNVHATVSLSQVAVKYFQKEKISGHIAVNSSLAWILGVPFRGTYNGTKQALHGYFNSLRSENMSVNLTVTLLCPGPVVSNVVNQCFTESSESEKSVGSDSPSSPNNDGRMSGERCGFLCAVALANKLNESWMALFPVIPQAYISIYFPNLYYYILKMIGAQKINKVD